MNIIIAIQTKVFPYRRFNQVVHAPDKPKWSAPLEKGSAKILVTIVTMVYIATTALTADMGQPTQAIYIQGSHTVWVISTTNHILIIHFHYPYRSVC